jgi:hypothetical protein
MTTLKGLNVGTTGGSYENAHDELTFASVWDGQIIDKF